MNVLVDTHALFWLLTEDKALSQRAKIYCRKADKLIIPTIVILELLYLLKKKNELDSFYAIFDKLKTDSRYTIVSLDLTVLDKSVDFVDELEMHDGIIAATAQMLDLPVVTKDPVIKGVYKNVIW